MEMFTLKTVAVANDGCPTVKAAMTKNPVTVSGKETVAEALYKMNQKNVLRLPVVSESGSVLGIIAKADIKAKQAELAEFNSELAGSCPVAKIAKEAITINENKNLADAYNLLNDEDIKSLVVVDNYNKVVGIITANDIAKLQAQADEDEDDDGDLEDLLIRKVLGGTIPVIAIAL